MCSTAPRSPLKPALEKCLALVKAKAVRHRINLTSISNGIPEIIRADKRKFKQVLYNLLSNAMKFTPDGGSVSLKADLVNTPTMPNCSQIWQL